MAVVTVFVAASITATEVTPAAWGEFPQARSSIGVGTSG